MATRPSRSSGRPVPPGGGLPRSASGSRASSTWMSVRRGRPRGDPNRRRTVMTQSPTHPSTPPTPWPVFAGIDWGGSHHQLCVLDNTGERLAQLRVTHDVAELTRLDNELARHGAVVPVAVERSEGLLVEHLQARGHAVFPCPRGSPPAPGSATASLRSKTTGSTRSCCRQPAPRTPALASTGNSLTAAGRDQGIDPRPRPALETQQARRRRCSCRRRRGLVGRGQPGDQRGPVVVQPCRGCPWRIGVLGRDRCNCSAFIRTFVCCSARLRQAAVDLGAPALICLSLDQ